jgi:hypothetical protein
MVPKTSAAKSRGRGESRRSGKTAAGWESVQGTAKREASCHHQPTPPPGRKNPAIVLYQADEFIESLLRHRLSFFDCEGGDVTTHVVAIVSRFAWNPKSVLPEI